MGTTPLRRSSRSPRSLRAHTDLALAALVLLAGGLAGCGDGAGERGTPLSLATVTASSSSGGPEVRITDPDDG